MTMELSLVNELIDLASDEMCPNKKTICRHFCVAGETCKANLVSKLSECHATQSDDAISSFDFAIVSMYDAIKECSFVKRG